jgi:cysteine desulfurase
MNRDDDIYLDYAAATPLDERVLAAMLPYFTEQFANPSAPYAFARTVKDDVEDARARIAHLMSSKPANITFTAGATEANNLAFSAVSPDAHIIASAIEHDSVLACVHAQGGSLLSVSNQGFVSPDDLEKAITPNTELVSIALANGEIGTIQPIRELAQVIASVREQRLQAGDMRPICLHTDASQAAATTMINVSSLGADLVTISAAKMYGPKQLGLLWAKNGIELRPLVFGGGQENGLRSGTENVAGIIGFARAFEIAREGIVEENTRIEQLRNWLQASLTESFPWTVVSGPAKDSRRLHNLLHISFPGLEARRLVIMLDRLGVSVGTGSACAASKMQTSPVLEAIGATTEIANGSLRITLGRPTTRDQVEKAAHRIESAVRSECERLHIHKVGN